MVAFLKRLWRFFFKDRRRTYVEIRRKGKKTSYYENGRKRKSGLFSKADIERLVKGAGAEFDWDPSEKFHIEFWYDPRDYRGINGQRDKVSAVLRNLQVQRLRRAMMK